MVYASNYISPIGKILIVTKNEKLIGIYLENQKYYLGSIKEELKISDDIDIVIKTKIWLDKYFNKEHPQIDKLPLELIGSPFQKSVWKILMDIPYGSVTTYNDIAKRIAKERNISKMSAQAIGGAVGHNPLSIIIPCHRVVGKNGSLTGYAGGIENKVYLLKHEQVNMEKLFIPKKKNKNK